MKLENIVAATGGVPPETGNLQDDYRALRRFLENLLRVQERNNDMISQFVEEQNGKVT